MELKAQMFKAKSSRAITIWRENSVKSGIDVLLERKRRDDTVGEKHMRFLGKKLWKM